jgi:hypothetical protein
MTYLTVAVAAVLVAAFQVTVVPLFPISGATAELAIPFILGALMVGGPGAGMFATPAIALSVGMAGDREPGLLLIAYTPALLFGYLLDRFELPPGKFPRLLVTALLAGFWVRLVLSASALAGGAAFEPFVLLVDIVTPGFLFDAMVITLLYVPLRLLGRADLHYVVERRGWMP